MNNARLTKAFRTYLIAREADADHKEGQAFVNGFAACLAILTEYREIELERVIRATENEGLDADVMSAFLTQEYNLKEEARRKRIGPKKS